jgi:hypothetical protein
MAFPGLDEIVESTFRHAVVKVDVSSRTPIIKDGRNSCVSEGTGFLVSQSYVATASHVFDVDPQCGELTILLRSRRHEAARIAKIVVSANDIALLSVSEPFPLAMCALALMNNDVYDSVGFRFGIPGQLQDPQPLKVRIGEKDSEWKPLVPLTPTPAEFGESGGPVIYNFNVVGVLKAKHKNYAGYSFMMVGSVLRSLMAEAHVTIEGRICNPVELNMGGVNSADLSLGANGDLSMSAQATVLKTIRDIAELTANRQQIKAVPTGSQVVIAASDKVVVRNECTILIGSLSFCRPKQEVVRAPVIASQTASAIKDQVSAQLWSQITPPDDVHNLTHK